MATLPQLYWIGVNAFSYITNNQGEEKLTWGKQTGWKTFKSPRPSSSKKVAYNKTSKTKNSKASGWKYHGATLQGTTIPATATRTINGVSRTVDVRYRLRGRTSYTRTKALKKDKKMLKNIFAASKNRPYQYQLQYKDKEVYYPEAVTTTMSGQSRVHFADHYWAKKTVSGKKKTVKVKVRKHLPHPSDYELTYIDIKKNVGTDNANNQDGRDNAGTYINRNVRANVRVINATWTGLTIEQAKQLLAVLNPNVTVKNKKKNRPYVSIQFRDPETNAALTKVFVVSERSVIPYANGKIKELSVTFEEV